MCKRCISKGLQCGGYPEKFRFCGIASRGKWKNHKAPISKDDASIAGADLSVEKSVVPAQESQSDAQIPLTGFLDSTTPWNPETPVSIILPSQRNTPSEESELKRTLSSKEAETLITHCSYSIVSLDIDYIKLTNYQRRPLHMSSSNCTAC